MAMSRTSVKAQCISLGGLHAFTDAQWPLLDLATLPPYKADPQNKEIENPQIQWRQM
jgi:hypothetical protein